MFPICLYQIGICSPHVNNRWFYSVYQIQLTTILIMLINGERTTYQHLHYPFVLIHPPQKVMGNVPAAAQNFGNSRNISDH